MNYGRREQEGLAGPDVPDSAGAFGAVRRLREENGYLEDVRHRESPGEISRRERETVKKEHPVPKPFGFGTGCFTEIFA